MSRALPKTYFVRLGATAWTLNTARWLGLVARDRRYFDLATASLSVLGYHHDLDEPVIHLWNDARD